MFLTTGLWHNFYNYWSQALGRRLRFAFVYKLFDFFQCMISWFHGGTSTPLYNNFVTLSTLTLLPLVAGFGLHNWDNHDFCACVTSDTYVHVTCFVMLNILLSQDGYILFWNIQKMHWWTVRLDLSWLLKLEPEAVVSWTQKIQFPIKHSRNKMKCVLSLIIFIFLLFSITMSGMQITLQAFKNYYVIYNKSEMDFESVFSSYSHMFILKTFKLLRQGPF